jgi:hypothetical protein
MKSVGYAEALSSRPSMKRGGKKELRSIEISKAENGGHIVEHRFNSGDGPYHSPEQHVFGADEGAKLLSHLKEHMAISAKVPAETKAAEASEE